MVGLVLAHLLSGERRVEKVGLHRRGPRKARENGLRHVVADKEAVECQRCCAGLRKRAVGDFVEPLQRQQGVVQLLVHVDALWEGGIKARVPVWVLPQMVLGCQQSDVPTQANRSVCPSDETFAFHALVHRHRVSGPLSLCHELFVESEP